MLHMLQIGVRNHISVTKIVRSNNYQNDIQTVNYETKAAFCLKATVT